MDKNYWKNYYEKQNAPLKASLFAEFVIENYLKENSSLLELGCGNGRDSVFFAHHGINVVAVDQCDNEIKVLTEKNGLQNLKFEADDFTKLGKRDLVDYVYSRFTLHSIKDEEETDVVKWSYEHIKNNGKLLIEARGKKNELYKLGEQVDGEPDAYIYESHYRRFIDIDILCKKLEDVGFKIILAEEKSGFAPFNDTDYIFLRVVASKE